MTHESNEDSNGLKSVLLNSDERSPQTFSLFDTTVLVTQHPNPIPVLLLWWEVVRKTYINYSYSVLLFLVISEH